MSHSSGIPCFSEIWPRNSTTSIADEQAREVYNPNTEMKCLVMWGTDCLLYTSAANSLRHAPWLRKVVKSSRYLLYKRPENLSEKELSLIHI